MTRQEQIAVGALAVVAAGVVFWNQRREDTMPVQGAVEGITWRAGYPAGHEHLAKPEDIGTVIWGPHPIYCDPDGPGKFRDPLIAAGWEWMSKPPSEATI